jgi:glycosyltransferase involved in cell wall biosynthesis
MRLGNPRMRLPTVSELPKPPLGKTGWPWTLKGRTTERRYSSGYECPRITLVTPSYNQADFVETTIRSVLLQGYPNLEYFVMDGNSSDSSYDVIRKYEKWITAWVSESDRGQSHAINKGLAKATGRVFGWLNSDDLLMPGALHVVGQLAEKQPLAAAWIGRCHRIDSNGWLLTTAIPRGLVRNRLADWGHKGWFYQPSCFFSATAWQEAGPLDESLHFAMDVDLWLRLIRVGEFVSTRHVLSAAVIHPLAKSQAQRTAMFEEIHFIQRRHGYEGIAESRIADKSRVGTLQDRIRRAVRVRFSRLFNCAEQRKKILEEIG